MQPNCLHSYNITPRPNLSYIFLGIWFSQLVAEIVKIYV